MALVQACAGTARLWARATGEEPAKAWATFAETVAFEASQAEHSCGVEDR
jgi:hypothetical protein